MVGQNAMLIKEKIVSIIRRRGPSIPVHIAKEIQQTILFTSAFLSELVADKELRISHMRVGSSPVYYIQGQEPSLERFSQYIGGREKDAFFLLKEKKFLKDSEQEPAIRVALRFIRDFAIPFKDNEEIIWRYYLVPQEEYTPSPKKLVEIKPKQQEQQKIIEIIKSIELPKQEQKKELEKETQKQKVEEKPKLKLKENKQIPKSKKTTKKKSLQKNNDKFFNRIKEWISQNSMELLDIESFSNKEIILKISKGDKIELLFAYDKKRISDSDIIKANKKAQENNLGFKILSLGEPLKKIQDLLEASKNLSGMEKIE